MKKCKKHIAAGIPGMMDGGRPNPYLLGTGMAQRAGAAIAGRGRQIDTAVEAATGSQAPASVVAPAGAGGMSRIRDGAMPPAHMLAAQRRGMADGGKPVRKVDGGAIKGPGGPTDDKAGVYALSDTEYVLPADTVQAMGGPEALDAIRAKTHKFVDPKNKPAIANGMANGGYVVNEMPVEEISMGRSRADRAAIDKAVQSGQRPPGMAKSPTHTPVLDRVSTQMQAQAPKAGAVRTIARGVPLAAAGGAIMDSTAGDSTARYAERFGVTEPTGDGSVADIAKFTALRAGGFASDLANNMTLGAAGNLYRDKPDGMLQFSQPAAAQPAPQQNTQAAQPAGQPAASTSIPKPAGVPSIASGVKVGGYEGNADIYGTSTRKDGKLNSFTGQGDPNRLNWEQRNPADYQAAVARAEADKAKLAEIEAAKGGPAIAMGMPQTFGQMMQFRAQMAMNRLNQRDKEATMHNQTDRMRIDAGLKQTPYDIERTRGAKMENDRASVMNGLLNSYLGAKDETARAAALTQLNELGGKNGDKYITIDVDTGQKDAVGNPVMAKMPFNTRTGQVVNVNGGGAAQKAGALQGKEGDQATDPKTGIAYVFKDGDWQPVK